MTEAAPVVTRTAEEMKPQIGRRNPKHWHPRKDRFERNFFALGNALPGPLEWVNYSVWVRYRGRDWVLAFHLYKTVLAGVEDCVIVTPEWDILVGDMIWAAFRGLVAGLEHLRDAWIPEIAKNDGGGR